MKTLLFCIVAAALLFSACKSSKNTVWDEDISVPADSVASEDIEIFIGGFDDLPLFNGKTADKDFVDYTKVKVVFGFWLSSPSGHRSDMFIRLSVALPGAETRHATSLLS